ncbi:hypothetical protein HNR47_002838 [Methylopila jiangsuensis]|nr:hypothetical protein [Methylopila jiangsuensis]
MPAETPFPRGIPTVNADATGAGPLAVIRG